MMPRENEEDQTIEEQTETVEEDLETLKNALMEEKAHAEANLAGWQRMQADFINFKRRCEQEKEETTRFANSVLILKILPVLDDLERAFTCIPSEVADCSWMGGIRLIEQKLRSALESAGLSEIKAAGQPFDPNLHEAVMQHPGKEGIVLEEVVKGYKLNDKVLRPSMVIVGNGEGRKDKEV